MSASAILNLLVGLAIGGWFVFGGLAGKISDAVGGDGGSAAAANTQTNYDAVPSGGGFVLV